MTICLLFQQLENIQGQYEDLNRLMDGLAQMQPFIESIKDRATESALKDMILALLYLIEDTSNFILNYLSRTGAGMYDSSPICLLCL